MVWEWALDIRPRAVKGVTHITVYVGYKLGFSGVTYDPANPDGVIMNPTTVYLYKDGAYTGLSARKNYSYWIYGYVFTEADIGTRQFFTKCDPDDNGVYGPAQSPTVYAEVKMPEIRDFSVAGVTVQPGAKGTVTIGEGKEVVVSCMFVPPPVTPPFPDITFFRAGKNIFVQPTNADGYMGKYWTPAAGDVGTYSYWCYTDGIYSGEMVITVTPPSKIIDFTAPTEAVVGSTVTITTNVYANALGDYYNYIVDAGIGGAAGVIDSTVVYAASAGNYTFTNDFAMPNKDLNYRIEYYDEPPAGYPKPV